MDLAGIPRMATANREAEDARGDIGTNFEDAVTIVATHGKVRRARLYYLRDLRGKAARIKRADREEEEATPVAATATAGTEAKA